MKIIGKTHFYCGFCGKLYSKEELDVVNGRHTKYEMNMIRLTEEVSQLFQKALLLSKQEGLTP